MKFPDKIRNKSMKIIGITGSPRRSQSRTAKLVDMLLQNAGTLGVETEYIDVGRLEVGFCTGCGQCHKQGYCVQKDVHELQDKLLAADGIILGSPVYMCQVSAQMKALIDHLGDFVHCQRLLGKYSAVVATSAGEGEKETTDYLEWVAVRTGTFCVGKKGYFIYEDGQLQSDHPSFTDMKQLAKELVNSIKEKKVYPEQVKQHEELRKFFRDIVNWRQEQWSWEYRYWQEKGWL